MTHSLTSNTYLRDPAMTRSLISNTYLRDPASI